MRKRIVVDESLNNIKSALKEQGYEVLDMNYVDQNPDAIVVSGMDNNVMGMHDIKTKAPIIVARGMDPTEVVDEIERKVTQI